MTAIELDDRSPSDLSALRGAFGSFPTGVTIVTTLDEGGPRGMTANSFTSVSLNPALLLVCISHGAASYPAFARSNVFAVNVLREDQQDVSALFASKSAEKFSGLQYSTHGTGAPVLTDCMTWFDCSLHDRVCAGDHTVLFGGIEQFQASHARPLGYSRGRYAEIRTR